jgi:ribosome-associated toxin RatA of RatAB toxin-antitoxin module
VGQQVSETLRIEASPATVLDVIVDMESYPEWVDGMLESEVLSRHEDGRPRTTRYRVDAKVTEISYTLRYRYEDDRVSWSLEEGDAVSQLDGSYELTPEDGATHVRYSLEVDVDLPLPGYLKKRAAKHILEQGLRGLAERAESRD